MSASDALVDTTAIELRRVLAKIALRKIEGLKLLIPSPFQLAFRESMAMERIISYFLTEIDRQWRTASRLIEVSRQDIDLSRGQ